MQSRLVVDAWANQFGVEPDDVLSQFRRLTRLIDDVNDQVLRLRVHVWEGPDRGLDQSVQEPHHRVNDTASRIRELHAQVIRERL